MNWYLVHTKPRQEKGALENLQRQGYTCYLPMFSCEKIRRGAMTVVTEALFPRYLFIQLDTALNSQSWSPIRSTTGVSRLVSFGSQAARVDEDILALLRAHESSTLGTPQRMFNRGDSVQLTDGAFAGIAGIYQMPDGDARAMVLIEIMSKQVKMSVQTATLRKTA